MERYPSGKTYQKLYARFQRRSPKDFINFAGAVKNHRVLDICAGSGRLSLEAVRQGAREVVLMDREKKMIDKRILRRVRMKIFIGDVEWCETSIPTKEYALRFRKIKAVIGDAEPQLKKLLKDGYYFDTVFCQQGVNYWLNPKTTKLVRDLLAPGGLFVFNTFNRQPAKKPLVKEYKLDGSNFTEVSWLIGKVVHHVQVREGMPCHTTYFNWLPPEEIEKILKPYFAAVVKKEGGTSLYYCVKK